jgi:hypothetical protein
METSNSKLAYQYLVESFHASDSTGMQNWLNKMGELGFKFVHAYEYGGYQSSKMSVMTLIKEYENSNVSNSLISFDTPEKNTHDEESNLSNPFSTPFRGGSKMNNIPPTSGYKSSNQDVPF